jgi:hypothetical protein
MGRVVVDLVTCHKCKSSVNKVSVAWLWVWLFSQTRRASRQSVTGVKSCDSPSTTCAICVQASCMHRSPTVVRCALHDAPCDPVAAECCRVSRPHSSVSHEPLDLVHPLPYNGIKSTHRHILGVFTRSSAQRRHVPRNTKTPFLWTSSNTPPRLSPILHHDP